MNDAIRAGARRGRLESRRPQRRLPGLRRLRGRHRPLEQGAVPGQRPRLRRQPQRARRRRHLQLRLRRSDDPDPRPGPRRRRGDGLPRQHADLPDPVGARLRQGPARRASTRSAATTRGSSPTTPTRAPAWRASPSSRASTAPTSSTPAATRPASGRRGPSAAPRRSWGCRSAASAPGTPTPPTTAA